MQNAVQKPVHLDAGERSPESRDSGWIPRGKCVQTPGEGNGGIL